MSRPTWLVRALPALALLPLLLLVSGSEAQSGPEKQLIGTWQGEIQFRFTGSDPTRTLVIESVTQQDGKWIGKGRYGITGKPSRMVQFDVEMEGAKPSIRLVTLDGSIVKLTLFGDKALVGTITLPGAREGGSDRPMKLEKAP
jgi:hypothetical protein